MSYTYGMKGAPAVGGGLGGLPIRDSGTAIQKITASPRAIMSSFNPSTTVYDSVSDCHYFSGSGGRMLKANSDGTVQWVIAISDGLTYTLESKWASGGTKAFSGNNVISISPGGSVEWSVIVGAGTLTISRIQSDSFGATFVFTRSTNNQAIQVIKLAVDGSLVWSRFVASNDGGSLWDDVAPGPGGAVYGSYYYNNLGIENPAAVSKVDSLDTIHPRIRYTDSSPFPLSLQVDSDGLVYICVRSGSTGSYPRLNIRSANLQTSLASTGFANAAFSSLAWNNPKVVPTGQGEFLLVTGQGASSLRFSVSRYTVSGATISFASGLITPTSQTFSSDALLTRVSGVTPSGDVWLNNTGGVSVLFRRNLETSNYGRLLSPGAMNFQQSTFTFTAGSSFSYGAVSSSAFTPAFSVASITSSLLTRDSTSMQITSSSFDGVNVSFFAQQV